MRLDGDDEDYNMQDVATVLGDSSANMLGLSKITDGKSRDKLQRVGDTVKLDQNSSREGNLDSSHNAKSHDKLTQDFDNVRKMHPDQSFDAFSKK